MNRRSTGLDFIPNHYLARSVVDSLCFGKRMCGIRAARLTGLLRAAALGNLPSGYCSYSLYITQTFTMALVNVWHLRKVAESSTKPCDICYKPTPSVLITPDNKVIRFSAM